MIVVDSSAMTEFLLETPLGRRVEARLYRDGDEFHAPHVMDLEVVRAIRRLVLGKELVASRAEEALSDLLVIDVVRHPHYALIGRIWQLRENLTVYDASYIALAEGLDAVVVTCDVPLGGVPGHSARVEVIQWPEVTEDARAAGRQVAGTEARDQRDAGEAHGRNTFRLLARAAIA